MKVLLVNGSSRKKGCTNAALCEVERALQEAGIGTEQFFIGNEALPDCVACRKCRELGRCVAEVPGAGAAGGFGAGMLAFFRAELQPGIEAVLDMVGFDRLLRGCDLVITGEGQLDSQSIRGKVISGVGRRSYWRGVPVVVIAGSVLPEMESITEQEELGVRAVFSVNRRAMDFSRSRHFSQENYRSTLENILRLITAAEHMRSAR